MLFEAQAKISKDKGMSYLKAGATEAADSISLLSKKFAELAKATGSSKLQDISDQISAVAQNFSAAAKGFASSGSWIGAVIGGVTDIITQTASAFVTAKTEAEEGNYYLLMGVLNSEFDGKRSFVELYGYTEILPGRVGRWNELY